MALNRLCKGHSFTAWELKHKGVHTWAGSMYSAWLKCCCCVCVFKPKHCGYTDVGVTNKPEWVGTCADLESLNNEDRQYFYHLSSSLLSALYEETGMNTKWPRASNFSTGTQDIVPKLWAYNQPHQGFFPSQCKNWCQVNLSIIFTRIICSQIKALQASSAITVSVQDHIKLIKID